MSPRILQKYQFGPYVFDPLRETLSRGAKELPSHLRLLRLLGVLLKKHGQTISRDELKRELWPDREDVPNPGRGAQAMEKAWRAKAASPYLSALLADALYHARDNEKAAERGRLAVESDPDFPVGHACLGKIRLQEKNFVDAAKHLEKARDLSGGSSIMLGFVAYVSASGGQKCRAEAILMEFLGNRENKIQYIPPFFVGLTYLGLGDRARALIEVKEAIKERSHWVLFLKTEPMFDPLRADRRFQSLLRTI
jgi:tetratricopeptide (TPR) repeat protein